MEVFMKSEIIKDLPADDYHSNSMSETPLFSYSVAKTIIQESPYHAWLEHPLLGGKERVPTAAMDKGNIIHDLLLGGGNEIMILQFDNYRTKAAQELRDMAHAEKKIPILEKDMEVIQGIVENAKKQIKDYAPHFFEEHESELSVLWEKDGVKTQSRFDWIKPTTGRIIDIKTTSTSANPEKLKKKILEIGYDIQESLYTECAELTWPEMAGRFEFEFIFIETESPYLVSVITLDNMFKILGERKVQRARSAWKYCLEKNEWPAYGRQIVEAPAWAVSQEEGLI
jgi:hypothetical protein